MRVIRGRRRFGRSLVAAVSIVTVLAPNSSSPASASAPSSGPAQCERFDPTAPGGIRLLPCAPTGVSVPPGKNSGGKGGGKTPTNSKTPLDVCNWYRASATGPDGGTIGAVPAGGPGLPEARRDNNGTTEFLQVRMCKRRDGTTYNTGETRWSRAGQPDPDPSGTIQRLYLLSSMQWTEIRPELNPPDPRSQILFLPTWITVPAPSSQNLFNSLTSPYSGATATATAIPVGINFDPGNDDKILTCNSLGVPWTYGDDKRLDNDPKSIPNACRYEYQDLPNRNGQVTARIGLRYQITYTGLTQPLDNGTMTELYDGPMTNLPLRVREKVAVNIPDNQNTPTGN